LNKDQDGILVTKIYGSLRQVIEYKKTSL